MIRFLSFKYGLSALNFLLLFSWMSPIGNALSFDLSRSNPKGVHETGRQYVWSRRKWGTALNQVIFATILPISSFAVPFDGLAYAIEGFEDPNTPPSDDLYDNPYLPKAPEERSGLVVLRVAEVAQFQEKILRAVASGALQETTVSPQQLVFGTSILLRNSNLDGNIKLMIYTEIPPSNRRDAIKDAVGAMNTLQGIAIYSSEIQRPFTKEEMLKVADMYQDVKIRLNQLYDYLPQKEKEKYYGYFVAVTEYEKKVANGTYNPDIDGILKFYSQ